MDGKTLQLKFLEALYAMNLANMAELIHAGANVNLPNPKNSEHPPLIEAIDMRFVGAVRLLAKAGADVNQRLTIGEEESPLERACCSPLIMRELILAGADVNVELPVRERRQLLSDEPHRCGARTALHVAARVNVADSVALLIEAGARVDAITSDGNAPLDYAVEKGQAIRVVHMLIDAGAKITPRTLSNIRWAVEGMNVELVQFLLDHGADPNAIGLLGRPLLIRTCQTSRGNYEVAKRLLAAGANPETKFEGKSALQWARYWGEKKVAELITTALRGQLPVIKKPRKLSKTLPVNSRLAEILAKLDESDFPMLDNGYRYFADARLHVYSDRNRWALLFEVLGVNNRTGFGDEQIENQFYVYSNSLDCESGFSLTFHPIAGEIFDEDGLRDEASRFMLRGESFAINRDRASYLSKGIRLRKDHPIQAHEFARALLPEYREQLLTTESELRQVIPADLPEVLRLNEWRHPDVAAGKKPSKNKTFQSLAKVLINGDASLYKVDPHPNTHWKNWQTGGEL